MQPTRAGRLRPIAGVHELLVIEDLLALHVQVDANDVLIHYATSADVHVTDLRVAHQAVRQTDGQTGGIQRQVLAWKWTNFVR